MHLPMSYKSIYKFLYSSAVDFAHAFIMQSLHHSEDKCDTELNFLWVTGGWWTHPSSASNKILGYILDLQELFGGHGNC